MGCGGGDSVGGLSAMGDGDAWVWWGDTGVQKPGVAVCWVR